MMVHVGRSEEVRGVVMSRGRVSVLYCLRKRYLSPCLSGIKLD